MATDFKIQESVRFGPEPLKVDETAQIIYGVKVIGAVSKNKRIFTEACRRSAHKHIQGLVVNVDHPPKGVEAPLSSRLGHLESPEERPDGTFANLHYLKSHPFTPTLIEIAKTKPRLCGFSIRGDGKGKGKDKAGNVMVESIEALDSADLVSSPANTVALNESVAQPTSLREEDAAEAEQEALTIEEHLGMLIACLTSAGHHDAASDHLKVHKKHFGKEEKKEEDGAEVEESHRPETREQKRAACIKLCESSKVKPQEGLVQALMAVPEASRPSLISAWKGKPVAPKSGTPTIPIQESIAQAQDDDESSFNRILQQLRN